TLTGDTTGASSRPGAGQQSDIALETDDEKVLQWFRTHWGVTAVVEPAKHGLELWAWIMPPAALALGLALVIIVVRKWRLRPAGASRAARTLDPHLESRGARARGETEI